MSTDKSPIRLEIGGRPRSVLVKRGLSGRKAALACEVDPTFVTAVVRGESMPSIPLVVGLWREFGVSPTWLLTGHDADRYGLEPPPPLLVRESEGPKYNASPNAELHRRIDEVIARGPPGIAEKIAGYVDGLADQPKRAVRKTA